MRKFRKRWLIVPAVAGLLALVVTGGAIFAQGNPTPHGGGGHQGILTRVAEILGLEESVVREAFQQAHQEQHDARLQERLDQAVANGRITQEEADAIWQWYLDKPDTVPHLRGFLFHSEEAIQRFLDRLAAAERITQEEADAIMEWYSERPEVLSELSSRRDTRQGFRGRGFDQRMKRSGNGAADTRYFDGASSTFSPELTTQSVLY